MKVKKGEVKKVKSTGGKRGSTNKRPDNVAAGAGEETAVKILLNRAFVGATMR